MSTNYTAEEMANFTGRTCFLVQGKLEIAVRVLDARKTYGFLEFLITPVDGSGQTWIRAGGRLKIDATGIVWRRS